MSAFCKIGAVVIFTTIPGIAHAAVVGFTGIVANTCTLNVTTPGLLGVAGSGTVLASDETGGASAVLTVVSTGNQPTITFASPTLIGPVESTGSAIKEIAYTSASGASQAFTAATVNHALGRFSDTFTVKGRVSNSSGFVTGTYTLSSVVTCQQ